jgi:hypothetical protein
MFRTTSPSRRSPRSCRLRATSAISRSNSRSRGLMPCIYLC